MLTFKHELHSWCTFTDPESPHIQHLCTDSVPLYTFHFHLNFQTWTQWALHTQNLTHRHHKLTHKQKLTRLTKTDTIDKTDKMTTIWIETYPLVTTCHRPSITTSNWSGTEKLGTQNRLRLEYVVELIKSFTTIPTSVAGWGEKIFHHLPGLGGLRKKKTPQVFLLLSPRVKQWWRFTFSLFLFYLYVFR